MTEQSASTEQRTVELPIETLRRLYLAIVTTSRTPEQEWQSLFNERVIAECIQCGIKVSGDELLQLATLDPEQPVEDSKLDRLRLKYCARNTCESRYYRVHIQPDSPLHWTGIKEQLHLATPEVREKKEQRTIRLPSLSGSRPLILIATLLGVVVLFFAIRYWVYGYRIPIVQKKNEYRVISGPQQ